MRKVGHGWAALDPHLHQARVWGTKKSLPASRSAQAVDWRIYLLPQTPRNGGLWADRASLVVLPPPGASITYYSLTAPCPHHILRPSAAAFLDHPQLLQVPAFSSLPDVTPFPPPSLNSSASGSLSFLHPTLTTILDDFSSTKPTHPAPWPHTLTPVSPHLQWCFPPCTAAPISRNLPVPQTSIAQHAIIPLAVLSLFFHSQGSFLHSHMFYSLLERACTVHAFNSYTYVENSQSTDPAQISYLWLLHTPFIHHCFQ